MFDGEEKVMSPRKKMSDVIAESLKRLGYARTKESQSLHNRRVEEIARQFADRGCEVWADHLEDWDTPPKIRKHIPDVYAGCGETEYVVEVETEETVDKEHAQEQARAFRAWRDEDPKHRRCKIDVAKKRRGLRRRGHK